MEKFQRYKRYKARKILTLLESGWPDLQSPSISMWQFWKLNMSEFDKLGMRNLLFLQPGPLAFISELKGLFYYLFCQSMEYLLAAISKMVLAFWYEIVLLWLSFSLLFYKIVNIVSLGLDFGIRNKQWLRSRCHPPIGRSVVQFPLLGSPFQNIIGQDTEPLIASSRSSIGVSVPLNCSRQASSALKSSLNVSLNGWMLTCVVKCFEWLVRLTAILIQSIYHIYLQLAS